MTTDQFNGLGIAITGGTSGLGRALVRELLDRGAHVAFVARHRDHVQHTARETGAHGIVGDVSRKDDIHPVAIQILGTLGAVDVLVNNASSLGPVPLVPLADTACEDFEAALDTNVLGPFRLTKALLGSLAVSAREGRRPVVVTISSDAASTPYANWGAYGASKAALQHLSRIWDAELTEEGIRVVAVDPGDMDTAMHAAAVPDADRATLKRPEQAAREIADLIASLREDAPDLTRCGSPEARGSSLPDVTGSDLSGLPGSALPALPESGGHEVTT